MSWIITVITTLGTILILIASAPKRKVLPLIGGSLITIVGIWQAYHQYSSQRTLIEIEAHVYEKLSLHTSRFLGVVSSMILRSSDGWLPSNEDEFFSRRSVDFICSGLNINASAPFIPKQSWLQVIVVTTQDYHNVLDSILRDYASQLNGGLVRAVSAVERSMLLTFPRQRMELSRIDQQKGWQRAPLLCYGLEELFEESFTNLHVLYREIRKGEDKFQLRKSEDWRALPLPKDVSQVGVDRFFLQDLPK